MPCCHRRGLTATGTAWLSSPSSRSSHSPRGKRAGPTARPRRTSASRWRETISPTRRAPLAQRPPRPPLPPYRPPTWSSRRCARTRLVVAVAACSSALVGRGGAGVGSRWGSGLGAYLAPSVTPSPPHIALALVLDAAPAPDTSLVAAARSQKINTLPSSSDPEAEVSC